MTGINRRISKAETLTQTASARCPQCASQPALRIVWPDGGASQPARCEQCGWEPDLTVRVVYDNAEAAS